MSPRLLRRKMRCPTCAAPSLRDKPCHRCHEDRLICTYCMEPPGSGGCYCIRERQNADHQWMLAEEQRMIAEMHGFNPHSVAGHILGQHLRQYAPRRRSNEEVMAWSYRLVRWTYYRLKRFKPANREALLAMLLLATPE